MARDAESDIRSGGRQKKSIETVSSRSISTSSSLEESSNDGRKNRF
jgi:hypothetical protein